MRAACGAGLDPGLVGASLVVARAPAGTHAAAGTHAGGGAAGGAGAGTVGEEGAGAAGGEAAGPGALGGLGPEEVEEMEKDAASDRTESGSDDGLEVDLDARDQEALSTPPIPRLPSCLSRTPPIT